MTHQQNTRAAPLFEQTRLTSGNARRCDECDGIIPAGEIHQMTTRGGAHPACYRACPRCIALAEWAVIALPGFAWACGSLIADVREEVYTRAGAMLDGLCKHLPPGFMARPKAVAR